MNKDHIQEPVLERFVFAPDQIPEKEQNAIRSHLRACRLCAEKVDRLNGFRLGVEEGLDGGATDRDSVFASSLTGVEPRSLPERGVERKKADERVIEAYAEVLAPDRPPLPARFVRLVRRNPVRSAGGAVLLGLTLLFASRLTLTRRDSNPTFAEIKDYVLTVYNKESEVLWKKGAPGLPDRSSNSVYTLDMSDPKRSLLVSDLLGDGTNDVLLTGSTSEGLFTRDTLYCFNGAGELRWKVGMGLTISFGPSGESKHGACEVSDFICFRRTPDARPQLFVLANEQTFSPAKLFEVDPRTGATLHSFYHRGGCAFLRHLDINGDGVQELFVGGINDGFNRGFLAVLDPAQIDGYAPVPPHYTPAQVNKARLEYYLLFPSPSLPYVPRSYEYGTVEDMLVSPQGGIQVNLRQNYDDPVTRTTSRCSIYFSLSRSLSVTGVMADDHLLTLAGRLRRTGQPSPQVDKISIETLRDSVLYWNGNTFVHSPSSPM